MAEKEYSDEELVLMLQKNDEEAFNLLYQRYIKLVYYIAFRICKNDADSQDIVQETFLQIRRTISHLENPSLFKYWINRITISKCKNLFRKNKYVTYDDEHFEAKNNLVETREDVLPEAILKFNSDKEVLDAFIDELPQGQKEVVILHYLEQFSVLETAAILDLPEGTVKSRLSYARDALRKKIELYEKTTGEKLNFRSLDCLLADALLLSFGKCVVPRKLTLPFARFSFRKLTTFFGSKPVMGVAAAAAITTLVIWGSDLLPFHDDSTQIEDIELVNRFPSITIRNIEITSAREAYFHIKRWACCKEEMELMDLDKLKDVYRLYEVMKADNSSYYHELVNEQWVSDLESVYSKRIR